MTLGLAEVGNRKPETAPGLDSLQIPDLGAVGNTEAVLVDGSGGRDWQMTDSEEGPVGAAGKTLQNSYTELLPDWEDDSPQVHKRGDLGLEVTSMSEFAFHLAGMIEQRAGLLVPDLEVEDSSGYFQGGMADKKWQMAVAGAAGAVDSTQPGPAEGDKLTHQLAGKIGRKVGPIDVVAAAAAGLKKPDPGSGGRLEHHRKESPARKVESTAAGSENWPVQTGVDWAAACPVVGGRSRR
jgi:hypothetical protein